MAPVGLSVQNPAEWERGGWGWWLICLGIDGGRWRFRSSVWWALLCQGRLQCLRQVIKCCWKRAGPSQCRNNSLPSWVFDSEHPCLLTVWGVSAPKQLVFVSILEGWVQKEQAILPPPPKKSHPKIQWIKFLVWNFCLGWLLRGDSGFGNNQ